MFPHVKSGKYDYRLIAQRGRFRLLFAAFDLWVGLFNDTASKRKYIGIFPTIILEITAKERDE